MSEEKKVLRYCMQLEEWCRSIKGDIQEFFDGKAVKLNNKISAMADLNDIDKRLLRKFVYIWWILWNESERMSEEEVRALKDEQRKIVAKMVEGKEKEDGRGVWFFGGGKHERG